MSLGSGVLTVRRIESDTGACLLYSAYGSSFLISLSMYSKSCLLDWEIDVVISNMYFQVCIVCTYLIEVISE